MNAEQLNYAPFHDHTKHDRQGHFAIIDRTKNNKSIIGVLKTKQIDWQQKYASKNVCINFAYFMYGDYEAHLYFKITHDNHRNESIVYRSYNEFNLNWHKAYIDLFMYDMIDNLQIHAFVSKGVIAIDDIDVRMGNCLQKDQCDFETSCTLFNDDQTSWKILQGSNVRINDHTTDTLNGKFYGLYTNQNKFSARTITKRFTYFRICIRFSYYIIGNSSDISLYYRKIPKNNDNSNGDLWRIKGSHDLSGKVGWMTHQASIFNEAKSNFFQIEFGIEMDSNTNQNKFVGVFIDDFYVSDGICENSRDCNFEDNDACSLEILRPKFDRPPMNDEQRLFLASKPSLSYLTFDYLTDYVDNIWRVYTPMLNGPYIDRDHTFAGHLGSYLVFAPNSNVERGIFLSERYDFVKNNDQDYCLSMAIVKPSFDSYLEIYQAESSISMDAIKLYGTNRSIDRWEMIQIQTRKLNQTSNDIYFFIVATVSKSNDQVNYVAIDDFQFYSAKCTWHMNPLPYTTNAPTSSTTLSPLISTTPKRGFHGDKFYCDPDHSIPIDKVCNYEIDCIENHLDELECGNCEIKKNHICGYKNVSAQSTFVWKLSKESVYGPEYFLDTSLTASSKFSIPLTDVAELLSPLVHKSHVSCRYSFYYQFNNKWNNVNDRFNLILEFKNGDTMTLWNSAMQTTTAFRSKEWFMVDFWIGTVPHSFRLRLSATPFGPDFQSNSNSESYHSIRSLRLDYCAPPQPLNEYQKCDKFGCANDVCIDKLNVCDFEQDCGDGTDESEQICDYVNRMTSFQQEDGWGRWGEFYRVNWTIKDVASFPDFYHGPSFDHTTRYSSGGRILYTNLSENGTKVAIVDGPAMQITGGTCMIRMFVLKNSLNSTLYLKLWDLKTNETTMLNIYKDYRTYYDRFYHIFPPNKKYTSTYKILLVAELQYRNNDYLAPFIAIDDISFSNDCTILPDDPKNLTTIPPDDFKCAMWCIGKKTFRQTCISFKEKCDFIQHCRDGSDEAQCGNCTFDNQTVCGWESEVESNNDNDEWLLIDPASSALRPFPNYDGRHNPNGGYFGYGFFASGQHSFLKSPRINGQTSEHCKLKFQIINSLSILVEIFLDNYQYIYGANLNEHGDWSDLGVTIGKRSPGFNVIIRLVSLSSKHPKDVIAIDNIRFEDCIGNNNKNDSKPESIDKLNCDFETDFCGWMIADTDDDDNKHQKINWFRTNRKTVEPGFDHTSQIDPRPKKYGTWVAFLTNSDTSTSTLQSSSTISVDHKNENNYCLNFWYYFFAADSSSLSVRLLSKNGKSKISMLLWRRSRISARDWQPAWIEMNKINVDFNLTITAIIDPESIIGIDDIKITKGKCPLPSKEFCDFENNICDWMPVKEGLESFHDGYTKDHTTGTVSGHFLGAPQISDPTDATMSVKKSISTLPFFPSGTDSMIQYDLCLHLYYYFVPITQIYSNPLQQKASNADDDDVKLSIQMIENGYQSTLKNISGKQIIAINQQQSWTPLSVSFKATKQSTIVMQISLSNQQDMSILIDDVRFQPKFCDVLHGNCNFETDMCDWYNSDDSKSLWIRVQPINPFVRNSGCNVDHTLGRADGNYLALSLDMSRKSTTKTTLRSPILKRYKKQSIACFKMYYFANYIGSNAPKAMTLKVVDLRKQGTVVQQFDIYAKNNNPIIWMEFARNIINLPEIYVIEIVAEYNNLIDSDIGIDDITITQGICDNSGSSPMPTSSTGIPIVEVLADCNFEHECHWKYQKPIWTVTSYEQRHDQYAPPIDHTLKDYRGHYLLYTNDGSSSQSNQYLIGPSMKYDKDRCLSFWFYADGASPFNVFRLDMSYQQNKYFNSDNVFAKFRILSQQSWRLHRVTIPYDESLAHKMPHIQIAMNFSLSNYETNSFATFAIDDIKIRPGSCQHFNEYSYSFTNGLDGLVLEQISPLNEMDAILINEQTIQTNEIFTFPFNMPHEDHTTFSKIDGRYLGFVNRKNSNAKMNYDYVHRLTIENVKADQGLRSCLRFAYQSSRDVAMKIFWSSGDHFDEEDEHDEDHLLWSTKSEKNWWTVVEVDKQLNFDHRIVFEIVRPNDKRLFFAIDDIIVMNRQCERPIDCDFNNDNYCSYTDFFTYSDQAFRIYATWSSTFYTDFPGPRLDHSQVMGNGFLMLSAWRWSPMSQNEKMKTAQIVSGVQRIESHNSYCLEIWTWINDPSASASIIMFGFSKGKFLYGKIVGNFKETVHNEWTGYYFTFDENTLGKDNIDEIQFKITGFVPNNPKVMIALDDIRFSNGRCNNNSFVCSDGKVIPSDNQCDFRQDCSRGFDEIGCGDTCNFEQDDCGWHDTGFGNKENWFRTSVQHMEPLAPSYAPKFDADGNKKGHFMMMYRCAGCDNDPNGRAEMALNAPKLSYHFKHSSDSCLIQFDYYAKTAKGFFLKVRFGDEIANMNTFYMIAHTNGTTQGSWTRVYGHIGRHWTPFIVEFSAFDQSTESAVAIDNINFVRCALHKPLSIGQSCSEGMIMCNQTRICIHRDSLCDGIDDCGRDGEDESPKLCGTQLWRRCSFESWSQCRLSFDHNDNQKTHWEITTGHRFEDDHEISVGYEPLIDNTKRSRISPYALLVPTQKTQALKHQYASIYTPYFTSKSLNMKNPCRLRLFYFWHTDIGRVINPKDLSLEVFVEFQNEEWKKASEILWSITPLDVLDQQRWYKAVVEYPNPNDNDWVDRWNYHQKNNLEMKPFRFVLRGWIHEDQQSRLAIDDLSYGFNCIAESNEPVITTTTSKSITDNPYNHHDGKHHNHGWKAIIFTFLFIGIVTAMVVYARYHYRQNQYDTERLIVSMNSLDEAKIEDDNHNTNNTNDNNHNESINHKK